MINFRVFCCKGATSNRTQVSESLAKLSTFSACKLLDLAPVSIFAFTNGIPSSGKEIHSRQPIVVNEFRIHVEDRRRMRGLRGAKRGFMLKIESGIHEKAILRYNPKAFSTSNITRCKTSALAIFVFRVAELVKSFGRTS